MMETTGSDEGRRVRKPATSGAMVLGGYPAVPPEVLRHQVMKESLKQGYEPQSAEELDQLPPEQKEKLSKKLIAKIRSLPRKNRRRIFKNFWKYRQDEIQGATRAERRQFWREIWEKLADHHISVTRLSFRGMQFKQHSNRGEAARRLRAMGRVTANRRRRLENLVLIPHQKEMDDMGLESSKELMQHFDGKGMTRWYRVVDL